MLNSEAMVVHFPAGPVACYPPALDSGAEECRPKSCESQKSHESQSPLSPFLLFVGHPDTRPTHRSAYVPLT